MYTTYIDNVGRNILIFDYSSGLAGFADFVLKLSKHEVEVEDEVLSYSNTDSNYCSATKTMHLDALHSTFFFI